MSEQTEQITQAEQPQIVEPDNPLPSVSFADMPPHWQEAAARAGWSELMPVQRKAMPYIMAGRDLMVQARTGSGKTGAFVLPILERINPLLDDCQALVLAPTRELAKQVAKDAKVLVGEDGPRVTAVYGGTKYGPQLDAFRKGAHLVVGTPGRVLDHLIRGSLKLHELQILVFDEADRMLSMGFYPDMIDIQSFLPERDTDTFMFSATYPPRVMHLAHDFMDDPGFLSLSRDHVHVTDVNHVFYSVPPMDKDRSLVRVIELENPDSALIFCNTRARVHYVKVVLERFGYNADEISSDLSQRARERVMGKLKEGKLRFLVATDVAARGIDIPELSHVIQYEPPADIEIYIHRAGRTGRAGASGEAVTLVGDFSEKVKLEKIERQYDIEFKERPLPSDEDVADVVGERLLVELESQMRAYQEDQLKHKRMERFGALAETLCQNEDETPLIAMLLDIYYQRSLGRPQTIPGRDDRKRKGKSKRRKKRRKRGRR